MSEAVVVELRVSVDAYTVAMERAWRTVTRHALARLPELRLHTHFGLLDSDE